jgi:ankyrin repeat protein
MDFSDKRKWSAPCSDEVWNWSEAVSAGDAEACRRLIDAGMDVNTPTCRNFPALIEAIRDGHGSVVRLLLERGANPNALDEFGWSVILYAGRSNVGHLYLPFVVRAGGDPSFCPPNAPDTYLTPFQQLVKEGWLPAVRFLVEQCGEDCGQRTLKGRTLMQLASSDTMKAQLRSLKTDLIIQQAVDAQDDGNQVVKATKTGASPL